MRHWNRWLIQERGVRAIGAVLLSRGAEFVDGADKLHLAFFEDTNPVSDFLRQRQGMGRHKNRGALVRR